MQTNAPQLGVVHVVEDDADLSQSIAWVLQSVGYSVETYFTADEFLGRYVGGAPSCLLADLLLPGMTGLKLCREIVSRRSPCAFVMISGHGDVPSAVEAMRLGAVDFLEKPFSHQRLLAVVDQALKAARIVNDNNAAEVDAANRLAALTSREREIFDAMAAGLVTKEIAKLHGISKRTVDVHRSRIMDKLHIQSHTQLAHLIAVTQRRHNYRAPPIAS